MMSVICHNLHFLGLKMQTSATIGLPRILMKDMMVVTELLPNSYTQLVLIKMDKKNDSASRQTRVLTHKSRVSILVCARLE